MPGLNGLTQTFRLTTNIRVAKYAALLNDPTNTTQQKWFAKIPPSSTPWLNAAVAGVVIGNYYEPNFFTAEDTDPATVTGTTPTSPYVLGGTGQDNGPGITVQYNGTCRVQANGSGTISSGDLLVVADQYGRVNNPVNLGITAGTLVYQLGIAKGKATAINQVLWCDLILIRAAV